MAVRKKQFVPNRVYFITFTICRWQKILRDNRYHSLFFKCFDYQKSRYDNKIHGYVIMPNHFHCLIHISKKSPPISKLIQNAKRFLAYDIVKLLEDDKNEKALSIFRSDAQRKKGAKHKVFEERFDSKIIENADLFREKLNYIHNNPCKEPWCLADAPEKYRPSSASNYVLGIGLYEVDLIS